MFVAGVRRWGTVGLLLLAAVTPVLAQGSWTPLFDGKSLKGWDVAGFKNQPVVRVEKGAMVLPAGAPFSGVVRRDFALKSDYEIRWEAMRVSGGDFFASLTFPAGDSFVTFVSGGWGGDIVGISSIDGWDAADNETRNYFTFESGKWYGFRVVVSAEKIQVWIDGKSVVDVVVGGRVLGLRPGDSKLTVPLGFMSYNTTGMVRGVEVRGVGR